MTPKHDLVLTTGQNWAAMSHRELYDAVHQNNDPGRTGELGWHWERFGAALTESARTIGRELTATESGWTGASAEAARGAIRSLAQWVTDTGQHATELGARVQEQSRIVEAARAAMPEPVEFSWDAATSTLSAPGIASFAASAADVQAANEQARAAHEQAVAVMTEMERQSRAVDAATPIFTAPFNPVTGRVEDLRTRAEDTADAQPPGAVPAARKEDETDGTPGQRAESAQSEEDTLSTGSPERQPEGAPLDENASTARTMALPDESVTAQQMPASAAAVPGELPGVPLEPGVPTGQNPGAAAAAAAAGAGAGAFAVSRGGGSSTDESGQTRSALSGGVSGTQGAEPAAGATPQSAGQPAAQRPSLPQPGIGPPGGMPSFAGAGTGGGSGSGGFGRMPGKAGGKQGDGDITLSPGRSVSAADFPAGQAPPAGPNASGVVGAPPDPGAMPPAGGVGRSPGAEDTERKTAYVQSEDIFDVPGDELPPSVIGGRKKSGDQS